MAAGGNGEARRARNPDATRAAILDAARTLLSRDGPEALSLSEVAQLAGVNRGTTYQHFATRERLVEAATRGVSEQLFRAVFGDPETIGERRVEEVDIGALGDRLSAFTMENSKLCRVWLLQLLASPDPNADPFWKEFSGSLARFAATSLAQPGIDAEALAMMVISGAFLWPVWAHAPQRTHAERHELAQRFSRELLRLCMYGSVRPECYPDVARRFDPQAGNVVRLRPGAAG
ncbi:MAG: TetR/AcrR family transcriptional regulator [Sandarakinorhabdus sp.]|nr:TetR/AcrR family transcriptional regulator [Sandarakinorhabdus sp.]